MNKKVDDNLKAAESCSIVVRKGIGESGSSNDVNKIKGQIGKEVLKCLLRNLCRKLKEKRSGK